MRHLSVSHLVDGFISSGEEVWIDSAEGIIEGALSVLCAAV
jgi:hypothetical protein